MCCVCDKIREFKAIIEGLVDDRMVDEFREEVRAGVVEAKMDVGLDVLEQSVSTWKDSIVMKIMMEMVALKWVELGANPNLMMQVLGLHYNQMLIMKSMGIPDRRVTEDAPSKH